MTRSALPLALAAASLLGLLLSGCGAASDSSDGTHTAATPAPTTSPASSSATATAAAIQRPTTDLPSDLRMVFDWPKTGDATKDAVLNDAQQYVRAYKRASALHDLNDPAYQFYSRNAALVYAHDQIKANIDDGFVPTGDDGYYDAHVNLVNTGTATLGFCRDQSKIFSRVVKTGHVNVNEPNAESYILYNLQLVHDDASNGVWQASQITVIEAAAQCRH